MTDLMTGVTGVKTKIADALRAAEAEGAQETTMVGRFGPRSRAHTGDTIDVAVETGALHFFDLETGLGIYSQTDSSNDGEGARG